MTVAELAALNREAQQKIDLCIHNLNPTMREEFVRSVKEAKETLAKISAEIFTADMNGEVVEILGNDYFLAELRLGALVNVGCQFFGVELNAELEAR